MELNKYKKILLSLFVALGLVVAAPNHTTAQAIDNLDAVNEFLNESAGLGEGSKANPVAVIPINHVDGPRLEEQFYAGEDFSNRYFKVSGEIMTIDEESFAIASDEVDFAKTQLEEKSDEGEFAEFDI